MNYSFRVPPLPDLCVIPAEVNAGYAAGQRLPFPLSLIYRWVNCLGTVKAVGGVVEKSAVRRILVVRLDRIGDLVMMTSFLRELKKGFPETQVTLVINPLAVNLFEVCPYVDELLVFKHPLAGSLRQMSRLISALFMGLFQLRHKKYDLAVLPRWDADSFAGPLLCFLSGARWRLAYSEHVNAEKAQFNRGYDCFFTHTIDRRFCRHEVKSNMDLLKCLGVESDEDRLELWLTREDVEYVDVALRSRGIPDGARLVALAPGASEKNKIWPPDRFIEVGRWLQYNCGVHLVIVGGDEEREVASFLEKSLNPRVAAVAGELTLRQTAALFQRCELFVGNDSGPMHLAAAVHVPEVIISRCVREGNPCRDQSPERFGPWGVPHLVMQPEHALPPCIERCLATSPHCILGVTVPQVLSAMMALMKSGKVVPGGRT